MKEKKKQYKALVGLEWDDLKKRTEVDEKLPDEVDKKEIEELLELGRIREVN